MNLMNLRLLVDRMVCTHVFIGFLQFLVISLHVDYLGYFKLICRIDNDIVVL